MPMSEEPKPARPSLWMLLFSAAATCYFVWALFFAPGEGASFLFTAILALLLIANLVFLVTSILRWRK
jgi:hypothetical protein